MTRFFRILFMTAAVAGLAPLAGAQEEQAQPPAQPVPESEAADLDALFDEVRTQKLSESEEHERRLQEFRRQRNQQQQLIQQVQNQIAQAERRSQQLEATQRQNEERLVELQRRLDEAKGELRELFGVLQQVAGDTRSLIQGSLVTLQARAQRIDRLEGIETLIEKSNRASQLPSIDEIEVLWRELMREMTQSGRITEFPYTVATAGGDREEVDLIRVGLFNLVANGEYFFFDEAANTVVELAKQPPRFESTAAALTNAQPGEIVRFGIDPLRGQLLQLLKEVPDPLERIDQGGAVGYVILALGAIGILIVIYKTITLTLTSMAVRSQVKSDTPKKGNPLGRILSVYHDNRNVDVETLELKLDEAILRETPALERGLTLIKIISAVAPLFGLLGTVTGMIETFQAITLFGTGDPKLMAGGISQALVTTVLGLVVAIPTLLLHSLVAGIAKNIIHVLEEQSAGIIAVHAEKERA